MTFKHYLSIVVFKTKVELKAETQRTYLGFLWWVIEPLMFLGIFYLVFSNIGNSHESNYAQFLLVGLVFWKWFGTSVSQSSSAILNQITLMRQVRIPAWVFPATKVTASTVKFFIIFSLLLLMLWLTGFLPNFNYIFLIELLIVEYCLTLGVVLCISSVVPFLPDIKYLIDTILLGAFFLSGVFFSIAEMKEGAQNILYLNPMVHVIESARLILMNNAEPNHLSLLYALIAGLILMGLGLYLLKKLQNKYAKLAEG